jgi:ergothioneine biosynthesis protein EgtB
MALDDLTERLATRFQPIRDRSAWLVEPLNEADAAVQSTPDASPAKWHLAHTSWFFETFVLIPNLPGYCHFHPLFGYLFNSYYDAVGARWTRSQRGLLTRPTLEEVLVYRRHVDNAMAELLASDVSREVAALILLGLHHEQQHQELLLTDILSLFARNPLCPAWHKELAMPAGKAAAFCWVECAGGIAEIGNDGKGFAFDCETPRHRVLLQDYALANRAVTCGEWIDFMADGGYRTASLWLADGWTASISEGWQCPAYWQRQGDDWYEMTLGGLRLVNREAPVSQVSFYEADAFAAWRGARLPTEAEWESAAASQTQQITNDDRTLAPKPQSGEGLTGLFTDVWEWTASSFRPYPGFHIPPGAVGEYNGKFMSGQMVMRGGSCVTPSSHTRATYRNFFQPEKRWQFSGLRLARTL